MWLKTWLRRDCISTLSFGFNILRDDIKNKIRDPSIYLIFISSLLTLSQKLKMIVPATARGMQTHKKLLPKTKNQEGQFAWSAARWGLVSMTNSANSLLVPAQRRPRWWWCPQDFCLRCIRSLRDRKKEIRCLSPDWLWCHSRGCSLLADALSKRKASKGNVPDPQCNQRMNR